MFRLVAVREVAEGTKACAHEVVAAAMRIDDDFIFILFVFTEEIGMEFSTE